MMQLLQSKLTYIHSKSGESNDMEGTPLDIDSINRCFQFKTASLPPRLKMDEYEMQNGEPRPFDAHNIDLPKAFSLPNEASQSNNREQEQDQQHVVHQDEPSNTLMNVSNVMNMNMSMANNDSLSNFSNTSNVQ